MGRVQYGKSPKGEKLERIKNSPNYKNGKFHNLSEAPDLEQDTNFIRMLKEFFFDKSDRREPPSELPSVKTDLKNLSPDEDIFVWFGHSSYFLQVEGKRILIDPVLSGNASPTKIFNKSYSGSDIYSYEDIPEIDYLLISHDHFDHLDYETVVCIKPKIKNVITGLGVGAHFEYWGYDSSIIFEKDWNETVFLEDGFEITATPSRHRSGRGFKTNINLWVSFVIKTPHISIFYSGDSGYGSHFKAIGNKFGPFDLAIMECGQYSRYWPNSHMTPEYVVEASKELKAKKLMPGHWAKFSLSLHEWDEPINKVIEEAIKKDLSVTHPMIGEKTSIKEGKPHEDWWERIK